MNKTTIAFIGGGNMAHSLIGGLISGGFAPDSIRVADPGEDQRSSVKARFGVYATADNRAALEGADVVVLAVKPQILHQVSQELAEAIQAGKPLVISIAAGVRGADLERWLGGDLSLVRTMPNTPALVQSGATGLYANERVSESQKALAESILRAVGITLWVEDESQLDAVTALSGSGPAYFLLVMEAMQEAGEALGLPADTARLLTLQTAFGAAKLALESKDDAATLRARVTSPGGTTERAIGILEEKNLREAFREALQGANARSIELADQLGKE
jgi:pyrroline-5-carboxylate reductase